MGTKTLLELEKKQRSKRREMMYSLLGKTLGTLHKQRGRQRLLHSTPREETVVMLPKRKHHLVLRLGLDLILVARVVAVPVDSGDSVNSLVMPLYFSGVRKINLYIDALK